MGNMANLTNLLFLLLGVSLGLMVSGARIPQDDDAIVKYIAENVEIQYEVINNIADVNTHTCQVTLTNTGTQTVSKGTWSIFFSHVRMIEPTKLPDPNGVILGNTGIRAYHINGCLFKFEPTNDFKDIAPKGKLVIPFISQHWTVARSDIMPNWYVHSPKNTEPREFRNTANEALDFVVDFDTPQKWKRVSYDRYDPYTPQVRFDVNKVADIGQSGKPIIPTPVEDKLSRQGKVVDITTGDWVVVGAKEIQREANMLAGALGLGYTETAPAKRYIEMTVVEPTDKKHPMWGKSEGYRLEVQADQEKIIITGPSATGVFYGAQSMISLAEHSKYIPDGYVVDYPRYAFRGLHVDVGRNFFSKANILKTIKAMARYKLNTFHFHLTDDEGWRLEVPGLEELTTMGSRRCHDLNETKCLLPQWGSPPVTGGDGTGFYTVKDYKEILQFAANYHIEVIPEFDMPGHGHAPIKAMEARYLKHKDTNMTAAKEFLLSDPDDKSKYLSVQMFIDNAINPCIDSTYKFVRHVVKELIDMHKGIQPLKVFHFGGDEVAKGAWTKSPICVDLMKKLNLTDARQLKEYFVYRVSKDTAAMGIDLGGWEDGLMGPGDVPYVRKNLKNKNVYVNAWQNIWEWGEGKRAYLLANAGYRTFQSQATHLYFDHPYEPDPEERGFYWAPRFIGTRKVFGFIPDALYENIDFTRFGDSLFKETVCKIDEHGNNPCPALAKKENIIGMQAELWSETVRKGEHLDYMLWPRMLSMAERVWHKANWESYTEKEAREAARDDEWIRFANAIGHKELARLDLMGIDYRVPLPGAKIEANFLYANTAFPGTKIQYSTDGQLTWTDYQAPVGIHPSTTVHLRAKSADGKRNSRSISIQAPEGK